ncbi:transposable element Tcb1 transposase [Trichonephila clavipes]|nr:transposable element Tcb1 transposase [Trichonephila clavipes]
MNNPDEKDKTHLESKLDTLKSLRIKLSDIRNEYYEVVADDSDLEPLESEILDLEDDCEDIYIYISPGNHQMARIVRHNGESVREGYIRNGGKEVKFFTSALKAFQCNNRIVMAQRKHLDDFLRDRIIGRLECGRNQLDVSEELGIAQSVISRLWQRFEDNGNLSSATGTTVSRQSVYRRLGHIGLYARRPVRCVPLTATHCRLRLTWSREHALWTPTTVVFECNDDRPHLSLSLYRDVILEQHVRLLRGAMGAEILFMDDNARPHRANIVDECLQSEDITRMDWPAYSPDLNPIEHV